MNNSKNIYSFLPFIFLIILITLVPLSITMYFENPVDLVKRAAFIIAASLLIISALIISANSALSEKKEISVNLKLYIDIPVLILLLTLVISTIFSRSPLLSTFGQYQREIGLITFIYLTFIYIISSAIFEDKSRLRSFVLAAELVCVTLSIYSIMQMAGLDPFELQPPGHDRPITTFGNPVFFGGFLVLVIPFSVMNISGKSNRIMVTVFPLIILAGIMNSGTRSAYIALIAEAVMIILILYFNRKEEYRKNKIKLFKKIIIILSGVIIAFVIFMLFFSDSFLAKRVLSIFEPGKNPRLTLWQDSFRVFLKYPFTGTGLAMFSSAFEEFYSNNLRLIERSGYFDHPHNNYLFFLYTAGLPGLAAYVFFLFRLLKSAIKNAVNSGDKLATALFTAFSSMFTGYCVYGLTNFDEITIYLYLFVFAGAFRSSIESKTWEIKLKSIIAPFMAVPAVIAAVYFIFSAVNDLKADRFFKIGNNLIKQGKFAEAVYNMNTAIAVNNYYSDYKYALAYTVYRQCFSSETMSQETKNNLLGQSVAQLEGIKNSHYFLNEINGLLSLIYYEMGNTTEAIRLENEVFSRDSVNINYRINLARYYLKAGNIAHAEELITYVLNNRPRSTEAYMTAAYVYFKKGDLQKSFELCNEILLYEPDNKFAQKLLGEINNPTNK